MSFLMLILNDILLGRAERMVGGYFKQDFEKSGCGTSHSHAQDETVNLKELVAERERRKSISAASMTGRVYMMTTWPELNLKCGGGCMSFVL